MNIETDKQVMIFVNEKDNKKYYQTSLSRKKEDGTYENGYIPIRFKQGVEFNNQDKIYIKNAFLTFYKKDKLTIPYIFVMEYETIEETIENSKNIVKQKEAEDDPFAEFGKSIKVEDILINDDDLPF